MNLIAHRNPSSQVVHMYDRTAPYWDSIIHRAVYGYAYRRLWQTLRSRQWIPSVDRIRVLDCGTGSGLLLAGFLRVEGKQTAAYGIDLSVGMLERARRSLERQNSCPQLEVADVCSLPFPDGEMDLVMAGLVFEHVDDPRKALLEMTRVARHGATFVIVTTRPKAPDLLYRLIFHYRHFRSGQVQSWMDQAGIRNICEYPLAGIARWFGCAYVGRKA